MFRSQRLATCLLLACFLVPLRAQPLQQPPPQPQRPLPRVSPPEAREPRNPDLDDMEREMQKKQNKHRQESLKKDTAKLLQLATELKQYVDKTNENLLSLEVVRKAEEIEKLAHNVRDKMKGQ